MRIRIKQRTGAKECRINSLNKIDNVELKGDILTSEDARIEVYFRGVDSSGILTLGKKEATELSETLGRLTKIVKGTKKIK